MFDTNDCSEEVFEQLFNNCSGRKVRSARMFDRPVDDIEDKYIKMIVVEFEDGGSLEITAERFLLEVHYSK
jgi:hypothetical protein